MSERLRQALPFVIGLVLFVVALEVIRVELHAVSWHDLTADVLRTPLSQLVIAVVLAGLNYAALTGYDQLAVSYIGKAIPRLRIAVASFVAYAISNNIGLSMVSGASVRYRFYTRWGVTGPEFSRIVVFCSITFWLGLLGLGGLSFIVSPLATARELPGHGVLLAAAWLLMLTPLAYVLATVLRRQPLRIRSFELALPSPRLALAQMVLSALEWTLAGAVLYALLPASNLTFLTFLGAFLIAILLGMASHVPGGIGVFEGLMILLLKPYLPSGDLLPALVVYRTVYYLMPLGVALIVLVADVARQHRSHAVRVGAVLGRVTEQLAPRVLAIFAFVAGLILLLSGSTPAAAGRLALISRVLPVGVIEISHFVGSLAGAVLLVLSQGLARRLDAAYYLTTATIVVGMAASLLKGADYEEAVLLLIVLLVLRRARPAFDRRAALFDTRFSPAWIAAMFGAVAASVWLGLFAFKHVAYSHELWWQFAADGDASRFLRAAVGAATVLLLFGVSRLIGYAPHEAPSPTDTDLDDVARAIAAQNSTFPFLVYLGDKALLFNDARTAFIMYAVQGRTWVALGDPVGPSDQLSDLVRQFLERCDDFGGVPVFYEVGQDHLHRYADFGLTFVKLGEEARVDLSAFGLEGAQGSRFRQTVRRFEKDGCSFRIVERADVPAIVTELRAISDEWLAAKSSAEKGFSLGFFDDAYIERCPVAVVEHAGRIVAFANVLAGPGTVELSIDLMRHRRDAPKNVMEALFVHLMIWGKAQGYRWFALGMAPMSGFETSPVASVWNRLGAFIYAHGDSLYSFQGLRAYKEKFNPVWEPHYLAYPGGLHLPRVMADVAALVAGGYRRIFRK